MASADAFWADETKERSLPRRLRSIWLSCSHSIEVQMKQKVRMFESKPVNGLLQVASSPNCSCTKEQIPVQLQIQSPFNFQQYLFIFTDFALYHHANRQNIIRIPTRQVMETNKHMLSKRFIDASLLKETLRIFNLGFVPCAG